jgi:hypothetical protein
MTPKQAKALIASQAYVVLVWHAYDQQGAFQLKVLNGRTIETVTGECFDRFEAFDWHPL